MPDPENGAEQELGPKIAEALQSKAGAARGLRERGMAAEARRRIRKRRQNLMAAAAAVVVVVVIGGVWNLAEVPVPSSNSASDSGEAASGTKDEPVAAVCPPGHPILKAGGHEAVPPGQGLDVQQPVYGLQVCRYRLKPGEPVLLGERTYDRATAQQVVDAIKVLPERNPDLPVFKCAPETAKPAESIVLRFETTHGTREIWVGYDGCSTPGFFTGTTTYGLYAEPLRLFMHGPVRPTGGTYLDALEGW